MSEREPHHQALVSGPAIYSFYNNWNLQPEHATDHQLLMCGCRRQRGLIRINNDTNMCSEK